MFRKILGGCHLLLLEQELLIQMDLEKMFQDAGAVVMLAHRQEDAMRYIDNVSLNTACLDYSLATNGAGAICRRLTKAGIPFMFYSGIPRDAVWDWIDIPFVCKPAMPEKLVEAVASLRATRGSTGFDHLFHRPAPET